MRIFITGASGYIGSAVASACARAGHDVYGLVRASEQSRALEAAEVQPVVGGMADPGTYLEVARHCQVIVHCAAESSAQAWDLDRRSVETFISTAEASEEPRLIVYTSGVWVYGDTGGEAVDEATAPDPPAFVAPRVESERIVLKANRGRVRTLVLRPGCVYGGRGGLTSAWFSSAVTEEAARFVGDGRTRWAMVHVEDLAAAYLRAIESPWGGEVFNVTDRSRFTIAECARAASRAAGAEGNVIAVAAADAVGAFGPMVAGLVLDQHVDSSKAVRLLGWQPRHGGFPDGVDRYFAAWRAFHTVG